MLESILVFEPASVPPPTPTPPPTPFPSPAPPGLFPPEQCNGDVPYSFVGWTTTAELDSSADHAGHVWAVVTHDAVPIGDWFEDPNLPRGHFSRALGRRVCLATELQPEGIKYNVLNGTAYREWDDGRRTPDDVFGPESGDDSVGPGGPLPSLPPAIRSEMRGPGLAPATILVRDWSELLVSARPATDAELAAAADLVPPVGARPLPGDLQSLLVVWAECGSDTGVTLVVTRDRSTVLIKADSRTDCVDPGARRASVLTFGTAVPPKVGAVAVL